MRTNNNPMVITVYLSKGGVAKSTLAALLGAFLAALGYRAVIIDLDRQGSQSEIFDLVDETGLSGEVLHQVLKRRIDIMAALTPVEPHLVPTFDGVPPGELYVVQGGPQTKEALDDISAAPVRYKIANTLDIVREPVQALVGFADYVIMDMGPSDQVAALAGLAATEAVLIPTLTDFLSVSRIAPVLEEIAVAQQVQPELRVMGIVSVMSRYYFGRLRKSKSVQAGETFLANNYGDLLLRDVDGKPVDIPYDEAWRNAMWMGENLLASPEAGQRAKDDALRFCRAIAASLGIETKGLIHAV